MTQIAEKAGVSIATVSRALKKPDLVKPETAARVLKTAIALGYSTEKGSKAGLRPRSGTVGLILPTIENSIFSEMISSLSEHLGMLNRTLLVASHNYDTSEEVRIFRSMLERRVDGVILIGNHHDPAVVELAESSSVPVVEAWNHRLGGPFATVGIDNELAGYLITKHCLNLGQKDFVLVFPEMQTNDRAQLRHEGALRALSEAGLSPKLDLACPYNVESAKTLGLERIPHCRNHSIICGNDVIALGVVFAAQALGLKIPVDFSVVGIGDFSFSKSTEPGLTTVRIPARTIGREAAELITRMIERPIFRDLPSLLLAPHVVSRGSCRRMQ